MRRSGGTAKLGLWLLPAGLCALLAAGAAQAQTPSPLGEWQYSAGIVLKQRFDPDHPKWEELLGFGGEYLPRFQGANAYHVEPGPTIDIRYRNLAFLSTGEGLGVNLLRNNNYRAGVALTYDLGRDEGTDLAKLHGLKDLSASPELKFFGEYVFFPVITRVDVRTGFGGHGGWIGDASVYLPVLGSKKFFVFAGASVTLADKDYMAHEYGVTQQESTASGLPVYTPGGGLNSAGIGANATWIFADHWFADLVCAATDLIGPPAESPLTSERLQYAVSLNLAYDFRWTP
jgi:outer membrane scaffolding protein for murein synthesis (MipA/OmpV family)